MCSAYNIAEAHQLVMEFPEYLQWDRVAPFLRHPVWMEYYLIVGLKQLLKQLYVKWIKHSLMTKCTIH